MPVLYHHHGRDVKHVCCYVQMATAMQEVVTDGTAGNKIALFSGHDTTVMPVLTTLIGDAMTHWPGYLSNVVLP